MLPIARPKIGGFNGTIFNGSLKPSSCRSTILPRILSMLRPRIGGKDVIILTGSVKPRSRRSAILRRTLSIASPPISGKEVTIFTGSAKPSSWRSAILSELMTHLAARPIYGTNVVGWRTESLVLRLQAGDCLLALARSHQPHRERLDRTRRRLLRDPVPQ